MIYSNNLITVKCIQGMSTTNYSIHEYAESYLIEILYNDNH